MLLGKLARTEGVPASSLPSGRLARFSFDLQSLRKRVETDWNDAACAGDFQIAEADHQNAQQQQPASAFLLPYVDSIVRSACRAAVRSLPAATAAAGAGGGSATLSLSVLGASFTHQLQQQPHSPVM